MSGHIPYSFGLGCQIQSPFKVYINYRKEGTAFKINKSFVYREQRGRRFLVFTKAFSGFTECLISKIESTEKKRHLRNMTSQSQHRVKAYTKTNREVHFLLLLIFASYLIKKECGKILFWHNHIRINESIEFTHVFKVRMIASTCDQGHNYQINVQVTSDHISNWNQASSHAPSSYYETLKASLHFFFRNMDQN